jgi:hypothetical protein
MINYSIPKPHALCGHFINIQDESEYNQMREIAEGCGFKVDNYHNDLKAFQFYNDMVLRRISHMLSSTQEITLDELRELAELSKIKLPCEMEVWERELDLHELKEVVDFYKGLPVTDTGPYYKTWANFRIPNHRAGEIKAKIKEHQEVIDKLNKELEGIK